MQSRAYCVYAATAGEMLRVARCGLRYPLCSATGGEMLRVARCGLR
jgi:hypothetical protein